MGKDSGLHAAFERPVHLHPALRIALALLVGAGGACLMLFAVIAFVMPHPRPFPHPVMFAGLMTVLFRMGCGFLYIGLRLMRSRAATSALLGPRARLIAAIVCGAAALALLAFAWHEANAFVALNALTATAMAWGLSRSAATGTAKLRSGA